MRLLAETVDPLKVSGLQAGTAWSAPGNTTQSDGNAAARANAHPYEG
jgi:hypothetical protein